MFGRKKKDSSPDSGVVKTVTPLFQSSEADVAWRQKYDQDRTNAIAEGRSCGKCVEGVVWSGPTEQTACNCDIAKKKAQG